MTNAAPTVAAELLEGFRFYMVRIANDYAIDTHGDPHPMFCADVETDPGADILTPPGLWWTIDGAARIAERLAGTYPDTDYEIVEVRPA